MRFIGLNWAVSLNSEIPTSDVPIFVTAQESVHPKINAASYGVLGEVGPKLSHFLNVS